MIEIELETESDQPISGVLSHVKTNFNSKATTVFLKNSRNTSLDLNKWLDEMTDKLNNSDKLYEVTDLDVTFLHFL